MVVASAPGKILGQVSIFVRMQEVGKQTDLLKIILK